MFRVRFEISLGNPALQQNLEHTPERSVDEELPFSDTEGKATIKPTTYKCLEKTNRYRPNNSVTSVSQKS